MSQRKGFSSIFKESKYKKIIKCTSSEEQENSNVSPLNITWSSDEDLCTSESCGNTVSAPGSSYCKTHQNEDLSYELLRKISRKRKLKTDMHKRLRKILSTQNNASTVATSTKSDPWSKVRCTFQLVNEEIGRQKYTNNDQNTAEDDIESCSSDGASATNSPNKSQVIDTPLTSQNSNGSTAEPTDLDLLIELIERDNNTTKLQPKPMGTRNSQRGRKGNLLLKEMQNCLDSAKAEHRFLEHDRKFGLRIGVKIIVLNIESSFGVHMATVRMNDDENNVFSVIIDDDMFNNIQIGSMLEAFFNEDIQPYTNHGAASKERIYVQPNKLLLL